MTDRSVIIPVIHYADDNQAMRNAERAIEAGCDGVMLIEMRGRNDGLLFAGAAPGIGLASSLTSDPDLRCRPRQFERADDALCRINPNAEITLNRRTADDCFCDDITAGQALQIGLATSQMRTDRKREIGARAVHRRLGGHQVTLFHPPELEPPSVTWWRDFAADGAAHFGDRTALANHVRLGEDRLADAWAMRRPERQASASPSTRPDFIAVLA